MNVNRRHRRIVEKMVRPPESVLEHVKRIGIDPIIDMVAVDGDIPRAMVMIGYDDLISAELDYLSRANKQESNKIDLLDLQRRIEEEKRRHPSSGIVGDDDDEWPIVGESLL